MFSKLQEILTAYIEKNVLYGFLFVYALSVITCAAIIFIVNSKDQGMDFGSYDSVGVGGGEEDKKEANIFVEISGAVENPGVHELVYKSRIVDLVKVAGGFNKDASEEWISRYVNLSKELSDSQKIYVPYKWDVLGLTEGTKKNDLITLVKPYTEISTEVVVAANSASVEQGITSENSSSSSSKLNINTASQEDIDDLPGIGPVYAARFIENRPYDDLENLKEKSGVSESVIEKIKDLVSY